MPVLRDPATRPRLRLGRELQRDCRVELERRALYARPCPRRRVARGSGMADVVAPQRRARRRTRRL